MRDTKTLLGGTGQYNSTGRRHPICDWVAAVGRGLSCHTRLLLLCFQFLVVFLEKKLNLIDMTEQLRPLLLIKGYRKPS